MVGSVLRACCAALLLLVSAVQPLGAQGAPPDPQARPAPVQIPQAARLVRIGIITSGPYDPSAASFPQFYGQFIEGLRDLGYAEGQNVEFVVRAAAGDTTQLPALAADLVAQEPDVIFAAFTPAVLAANQATSTIPIVMPFSGDPVGSGLVQSLEQPGGNVTGLTNAGPLFAPKRLQLLAQVVPGGKRFGFVTNPRASNPAIAPSIVASQQAAQSLRAEALVEEVPDLAGFAPAFDRLTAAGAAGFVLYWNPLSDAIQARVFELALSHRLPGMYETTDLAKAGGLMAYGPNIPDLYRRSATYVARIVQGADPAELPVGTPERFDFAVNLRTAAALGITLPSEILAEATEVIE